jgi:hypothetical protein
MNPELLSVTVEDKETEIDLSGLQIKCEAYYGSVPTEAPCRCCASYWWVLGSIDPVAVCENHAQELIYRFGRGEFTFELVLVHI